MLADFPKKLRFLFDPWRYKVAYGGRGGAKSWNFARALLILGAQRQMRILCARETMKSIADSVHQLLADQIRLLGLTQFYTIEKARITGQNETTFIFGGLKHDVGAIKSTEAIDIVWVEEAQNVSKHSWDTLIPTVRKDGSEIWVSFNPDFEDDDTYARFVLTPSPRAKVVKIGWQDNPWFPPELEQERLEALEKDPDDYAHIWEGQCINIAKGAIYAFEMRTADAENRLTRVPYDRARPVDCYWDLGYGDYTAVWFAQAFPFEYRLIDYIEANQKSLQWYLSQLQARGYVYGTDWLPWDLGLHAHTMGSGKSIEELMRLAGRKVRIVPKLSVADGINAARTVFPQCWFDREKCAEGIRALRTYRYGEIKTLQHPGRDPLHDAASHGADAFRYFALVAKPPKKEAPKDYRRPAPMSAWS